jgi:hypothetical protein
MARLSPASWLYALTVTSIVCGLVLFAMPRAVEPTDLPVLTLSAAEVEQVEREDARLAQARPNTPAAQQLMTSYLTLGRNEANALGDDHLLAMRKRVLHHEYEAVVAESGKQGGAAMRSYALEQFEAALDSRIPADKAPGLLGVFPSVLAQHYATRDGVELAPHFVVRTLYKARWNRMVDLPLDEGFARIEKLAYYGWLGLHAENLSVRQRRDALVQYAAAGGNGAAEAQGVLAFQERDYAQAVDNLQRAYAENPSLRLRNYLRGARVAAGQAGGPNATAARDDL